LNQNAVDFEVKQANKKPTQSKQKSPKPQAKILPVVRKPSLNEENLSPDTKKAPYPLEAKFEMNANDELKQTANYHEAPIENVDPGTPVGQALTELLDTTNAQNQWLPSYDVSHRKDDPNAVKIITVGVTEDGPIDEKLIDESLQKSRDHSNKDKKSTKDQSKVSIDDKLEDQSKVSIDESTNIRQAKRKSKTNDEKAKIQKINSIELNAESENQQSVLTPKNVKQEDKLDETTQQATQLDASFDREVQLKTESSNAPESQKMSTKKSVPKADKEKTKIDENSCIVIEQDKQKSINLQVNIEDSSVNVGEKQKTKKPESKANKKSQVPNAESIQTPNSEGHAIVIPELLDVLTNKATTLDVDLNKMQSNEVSNIDRVEQQKTDVKKSTSEPSKKTTKLDVDLKKKPSSELTTLDQTDVLNDKTTKEINEPSQKSTKLDVDLNKEPSNEVSNIDRVDQQKTDVKKSANEPSKKSTTLDADLSKQPSNEESQIDIPEKQQNSSADLSSNAHKIDKPKKKITKKPINKDKSLEQEDTNAIDTTKPDVEMPESQSQVLIDDKKPLDKKHKKGTLT
jgi:hypothetical protein